MQRQISKIDNRVTVHVWRSDPELGVEWRDAHVVVEGDFYTTCLWIPPTHQEDGFKGRDESSNLVRPISTNSVETL